METTCPYEHKTPWQRLLFKKWSWKNALHVPTVTTVKNKWAKWYTFFFALVSRFFAPVSRVFAPVSRKTFGSFFIISGDVRCKITISRMSKPIYCKALFRVSKRSSWPNFVKQPCHRPTNFCHEVFPQIVPCIKLHQELVRRSMGRPCFQHFTACGINQIFALENLSDANIGKRRHAYRHGWKQTCLQYRAQQPCSLIEVKLYARKTGTSE